MLAAPAVRRSEELKRSAAGQGIARDDAELARISLSPLYAIEIPSAIHGQILRW